MLYPPGRPPPLSLSQPLELVGAPAFRSGVQGGPRRARRNFRFLPSGVQEGVTPLRKAPCRQVGANSGLTLTPSPRDLHKDLANTSSYSLRTTTFLSPPLPPMDTLPGPLSCIPAPPPKNCSSRSHLELAYVPHSQPRHMKTTMIPSSKRLLPKLSPFSDPATYYGNLLRTPPSSPPTKLHNDIPSPDAISDTQRGRPSEDFFRHPAPEIRTPLSRQLPPAPIKKVLSRRPYTEGLCHTGGDPMSPSPDIPDPSSQAEDFPADHPQSHHHTHSRTPRLAPRKTSTPRSISGPPLAANPP